MSSPHLHSNIILLKKFGLSPLWETKLFPSTTKRFNGGRSGDAIIAGMAETGYESFGMGECGVVIGGMM